MPYCVHCGQEVTSTMRYCPACGKTLNQVTEEPVSTDASKKDYSVYLVNKGTANKLNLRDLLVDMLGYTPAQAMEMLDNIPVEIATNLTVTQAAVIAQAFEEYGAEVTVGVGDEAVNIDSKSRSNSLFASDGGYLGSVAAVLASLSAANRLTEVRPWKKPAPWIYTFHSNYQPTTPPRHVRRENYFHGPRVVINLGPAQQQRARGVQIRHSKSSPGFPGNSSLIRRGPGGRR